MSRTKVFFQNVSVAALLQLVTMVAGFILPRIILGAYGSEINGLVISLSQFIAWFNLVEAGISASATYALYEPIARKDIKKINGILAAIQVFFRKTGYIFLSLSVVFALLYPIFISVSMLSRLEVCVLVIILAAKELLEYFFMAKYRVYLTADQKMYVISLASIVAIFCNIGCFVGMVFAGFSIVVAKFVSLLSVFMKSWIIWRYCHKRYKFFDFDEKPIIQALDRRWDAFYLQILGLVHNGAPVILATVLTDLKTVSIFSIYSLVNQGLQGILGIISSGLAASFGDVIVRKEEMVLQRAASEFEFFYCLLCAGLYGSALLLIVPFVMIYTQGIADANYYQPYLGGMVLLNGLLYGLKNPQGMLVISAGLYRETRWQTTTQGMIELFGGLILGWIYGIEGIVYGMILSNVYRGIDLPFFICRNVTKLSPWKTFQRMGYAFFVIGVLWYAASFISIAPQDFRMWMIDSVRVSCLSFVIVLVVGFLFEPKTCKSLMGRVRLMNERKGL